jgi:hypothetical protein
MSTADAADSVCEPVLAQIDTAALDEVGSRAAAVDYARKALYFISKAPTAVGMFDVVCLG